MRKAVIVVVGAGPAGLSCAIELASAGHEVTLVERKTRIGQKVCAGGITWNGLMQYVPEQLIQKKFYTQKVVTPLQNITLTSPTPMLATINRVEFGQYLLKEALQLGVKVLSPFSAEKISSNSIQIKCHDNGGRQSLKFDYLIGADGANSTVRKYLRLPVERYGVGIHYDLPVSADDMEWHFAPELFENGYGWIFPHKESVSVGAFADSEALKPIELKKSLVKWASLLGYKLDKIQPKSEKISYDYRGYRFNNVFLIGEAAGLTSALTGEGINAAIISAQIIANEITSNKSTLDQFSELLNRHARHAKLIRLTNRSRLLKRLLPELATAGLRTGFIKFDKLELTT